MTKRKEQPCDVQALDVHYNDAWYVRRHYKSGDWLCDRGYADPQKARERLVMLAQFHGLWVHETGDWACRQEHAEAWALCRWAGARVPNGPTAGMLMQPSSDLVRAVELILAAKATGENILTGVFAPPQK